MLRSDAIRRDGYLLENYRYFHLRDTAGQEKDFHFHEFDKVVILLSGHVTYEVETSDYELKPWDILLIRHHTIHKACIDREEPYERIILYIDSRYIERESMGESLSTCFDNADKQGRHCLRPDEETRLLMQNTICALEAESSEAFGFEIMRNTMLLQLLVQINRISAKTEYTEVRQIKGTNEKITHALTYINENLESELTIDRLAASVYLSRYHFMRLFKEQTGYTVHGYIKQKRLLNGAKLIRSGVPVTEAALTCGYTDYSSFYRAFRDCFGANPSDLLPHA